MKKGYFAAYLGGAATMGIVLANVGKMAKKYGQPIKQKKGLSVEKLVITAEKGLDFITNQHR